MLTSDIIPLDPADPAPRRERLRRPLPWRWIIAGFYLVFALVCILVATQARAADDFYPACLAKSCFHRTCTEDWAGGKPLTKHGICQCQKYGGTAYVADGVKAKRAKTCR